MLNRLAELLRWPGRVRRFDVPTAPVDVLMQSSLVLRGLGVPIRRLDVDAGTLEARLAVGGVLRLRASVEGDGSRVAKDSATIEANGTVDEAQDHWARFTTDPRWLVIKASTEQDGPLIASISITYLTTPDYITL